MSYPPGVPMTITRPLYAASTGAMMVQMAPVRQVPVSQVMVTPVMHPVLSQSQSFVTPHTMGHIVTNQSQATKSSSPKIVIQAEPTKNPNYVKPGDSTTQLNGSEADPAITVFVGNITDRASDTLVRQILMKCGSVLLWKRVQGASGKLQAFGFCEYKDPESALRAIHILHDYVLGDKKLLVKVDAKTQEVIDEWKKKKGLAANEDHKLPGIDTALTGLHSLIQEYLSELNTAKPTGIEKDSMIEILKPDPTVRESHNVEENLEELELEDDQKSFISKEIRLFRETQKQQEEKMKNIKDDKDKPQRSEEKSSHSRSSTKKHDRESRDREKNRDRRDRDRDRDRDRSDKDRDRRDKNHDRDRRARSPVRSSRRSRSITPRRADIRRSPIRRRSRTPVRSLAARRSPPRRARSPAALRKRTSSRSPVSWRRGDDDEEYEAQERRKLERKIKEKEAAYQERLRAIEMRERRQKRASEKLEQRQISERKEMVKEAKRLREFLADYEDDRSDGKYYVGNALTKRLREREREIEADERDRKKEKEEVDALRKRLLDDNNPDLEAAVKKFLEESDNAWKPLIQPDTPPRKSPAPSPPPAPSSSTSSDEEDDSASDEDSEKSDSESSEEPSKKTKAEVETQMVATLQPVKDEAVLEVNSAPPVSVPTSVKVEAVVKMEFAGAKSSPAIMSTSTTSSPQLKMEVKLERTPESITPTTLNSKRRKLTVSDVFNQDEEEDELPKKRKLVPLTYTDAEKDAINPAKAVEEKRKLIRALIERIPTQKDDLFDYGLDWSMVDPTLMEKRIQPWISKKILEYIGEEEPTLVEFICSKIMTKSSPEKILEDIAMVLDDEADVFVVKMWRLLIYETEAKKEGLNK